MTEAEFDEHVSPLLLKAAHETDRFGGALISFCQYDGTSPDADSTELDNCTTRTLPERASAHVKLVDMAARCKGNLDSLLFGLARAHNDGVMDLSQTMLASWMKLGPFKARSDDEGTESASSNPDGE